MRLRFPILSLGLFLAIPGLGETYEQSQVISKKHYKLGLIEFHAGRISQAKRHFQTVLHHEPKHSYANAFLAQIEWAEKKARAGRDHLKELTPIVLPSVELKKATLVDSVEFVRKSVAEMSGGKLQANIIVMTSPGVKAAPITLSLRDAAVPVVLQYLAELSGAELRYDPYAIVLRDQGTAAAEEKAKADKAVPKP